MVIECSKPHVGGIYNSAGFLAHRLVSQSWNYAVSVIWQLADLDLAPAAIDQLYPAALLSRRTATAT